MNKCHNICVRPCEQNYEKLRFFNKGYRYHGGRFSLSSYTCSSRRERFPFSYTPYQGRVPRLFFLAPLKLNQNRNLIVTMLRTQGTVYTFYLPCYALPSHFTPAGAFIFDSANTSLHGNMKFTSNSAYAAGGRSTETYVKYPLCLKRPVRIRIPRHGSKTINAPCAITGIGGN